MTVPLIILAMLSIVGGYIGVPAALGGKNHFEHFLEPAIAKFEPASSVQGAHGAPAASESHGAAPAAEPHGSAAGESQAAASHEGGHDVGTERMFTAISSVVAILGILFGLWFFKRDPLWRAPKLLEDKYRVDELYDETVVGPIEHLSRDGLWKFVDVKIIDGFVNGVARLFAELAGALRYTQSGFARNYAAVILVGAIIVIGYFGYAALR
jgi:NADH-quinone oxidoreductase subunit L